MAQYGNTSKPPWVRSGQNMSVNVSNTMPPMSNTGMIPQPYHNPQHVFQGQVGVQQIYGSLGPVSYPTRALNSAAFSNNSTNQPQSNAQQGGNNLKQRVFTGTVTKIQDNFGIVDDEVFFQTSCCVKGSQPRLGDKVLVEALYNPNMPYKWNATRIQVLPSRDNSQGGRFSHGGSNYGNQMPPRNTFSEGGSGVSRFENSGGGGGGGSRFNSNLPERRERERGRERNRRDDSLELDRKRKRDDRDSRPEREEKERAKSPPARRRSKSPLRAPRRVARKPPPRYAVHIPKITLDNLSADVVELKRRFANMYIPSDFFTTKFSWVKTLPVDQPLALNFPCSFHLMHKDVDPPVAHDAVHNPPDLDYIFSAKVMLMSSPGLDDLYSKCLSLAEDREGSRSTDDDQFSRPSKMIQFLIGLRGKETMAIGGPWSPSLDGQDPANDPVVLINTAKRTCLALTGIDLSNCTQWFRFLEIHYHRAETVHKGKTIPARVETVVLFVPDVWSCSPTRPEWDDLHTAYQKQLARKLNPEDSSDDKDEDGDREVSTKEPKHHSELDPKNMKVNELKEELEARGITAKGLKSQLAARLAKAIKAEAEEEAAGGQPVQPKPEKKEDEKKKEKEEEKKKEKEVEEEPKKLDEREKALLEKRYKLPENPHIIVHPNRLARSGKFDCSVMTLANLLSYRPDDTKEHSFEVSLFAELFNEMLMRDFGYRIFKCMLDAPEKPKEEEKDKKKSKDDKDKKDDKAKDDKKDDKDKDRHEDDDEDMDDNEDDDDKDKKDKKKERVKLYTADPYLLLSFSFFDMNRCGYIYDKDLEDLLFCLGLSLSRAQVRRLLQKVCSRDILYYRKLTDRPKGVEIEAPKTKTADSVNLAFGNKRILEEELESPSKKSRSEDKTDSSESGLVCHKGTVVDISKLLEQLKRSETSRVETEKSLSKTKSELSKAKDNCSRSDRIIKDLSSELKDYKDRLSTANSEVCSLEAKSRSFVNALTDIQDIVRPLLHRSKESDRKRDDHDKSEKRKETKVDVDDDKSKKHEAEKEKEKEKEKKVEEKPSTPSTAPTPAPKTPGPAPTEEKPKEEPKSETKEEAMEVDSAKKEP